MTKEKNSFFEEEDSKDPSRIKNAVKTTKDTMISSNVGEYYGKNVIYKYKDGISCTVVYDGKDTNYITRQMN
jgi:hypothetical protein